MFEFAFANAQTGSSAYSGFILIIVIFFLFWLLIIRPQSKKMKEHQTFINSLQKGDKVITHSGIIGKITKVGDTTFTIEIAEGTNVLFDKNYITKKYEPSMLSTKNNSKN